MLFECREVVGFIHPPPDQLRVFKGDQPVRFSSGKQKRTCRTLLEAAVSIGLQVTSDEVRVFICGVNRVARRGHLQVF
ncbi:MAG: hypothetical protein JWQ08_1071 [Deinococcus sp.]|nr:hypothetical protein [Deinococcus sp.]